MGCTSLSTINHSCGCVELLAGCAELVPWVTRSGLCIVSYSRNQSWVLCLRVALNLCPGSPALASA